MRRTNNRYAAFRAFTQEHIAPYADEWDSQERLPNDIIRLIAKEGYLGALVPREYGGLGLDMVSYGELSEALGSACTSVRSLVTAHGMVCRTLTQWGSPALRQRWLPELASGSVIAAFAMTEADAGSDIHAIRTSAVRRADGFRICGEKRWVTFGQIAELFLLFARCDGGSAAFLVDGRPAGGKAPPITRVPVTGLLGARASGLAALRFHDYLVPQDHLLGSVGFGLSTIGAAALDLGRYSVAWGCIGLARAAAEASIQYAATRQQFGSYLRDHQVIAAMVADMLTKVEAARLLCLRAGQLRNAGDPRSVLETCMAKYLASTACLQIASDAVQIHGANGCGESAVQRYFRDAKVMEIIEGSSQMQQIMIARQAFADPQLSRGQHR